MLSIPGKIDTAAEVKKTLHIQGNGETQWYMLRHGYTTELYETAGVSFGLFLNFTFVNMRGPNKTIETETVIITQF